MVDPRSKFLVSFVLIWLLIDRKRLTELLFFVTLTSFIVSSLDAIGSNLTLWVYVYRDFPTFNRLVSVDSGTFPLLYLIMYQYVPKWSHYLLVQVLASLIFSFLFETIFQLIGILQYLSWRHIYSFPIYILIGVIMKAVVERVKKREARENYRDVLFEERISDVS
jgi:hypothetical protein